LSRIRGVVSRLDAIDSVRRVFIDAVFLVVRLGALHKLEEELRVCIVPVDLLVPFSWYVVAFTVALVEISREHEILVVVDQETLHFGKESFEGDELPSLSCDEGSDVKFFCEAVFTSFDASSLQFGCHASAAEEVAPFDLEVLTDWLSLTQAI